ncbi:hypothetical protein RJ640_018451 [Escallonia rubra]|uniref:CSC1-like protein RXW8 n=1 Tax=Escallonia rubra TaxID=112253 RepID=A0AA88QTB9_9ASTE|nr:hypothetical protein RJ640_018451 [Escallonia rubra]
MQNSEVCYVNVAGEMNITGLMTSAGINTAICFVLFSLFSVLRKQPCNAGIYFGQRIAQVRSKRHEPFCFDRLVPSASWIMKAWRASEEDIIASGGLDAMVFLRIIVFSIQIFSIAATICIFLVLPLNYFGQEMQHKNIPSESLEVFTIGNVKEGSRWLWAHCLALYVITCSACGLLYIENKNIANMRLAYVSSSPPKPSQFTVLVRAIPWSSEKCYSDLVTRFFTKYYGSSYLSHQMIYRSGTVQKLMTDAEKMYKMLKSTHMRDYHRSSFITCGLCGGTASSFQILAGEPESAEDRGDFTAPDLREKECAAVLVFFRTRFAANITAKSLLTPNPMQWVTDLAPEPNDVFWSNLCIPYRLLWIRRVATLSTTIVFMLFSLGPVGVVCGLANADKLQNLLPFLRGILERKFMSQLVTGYLPSVILILFLYIVPPIMMLFSAVEGSISHSGRKKSACIKVLYFLIWNVFFANILVGSFIDRLDTIQKVVPREMPTVLAKLLPEKAFFFTTYVLTSGWASLASELVQPFVLLCNLLDRLLCRNKGVLSCDVMSFPYHTEIPRLLVFGLIGFTFCIFAPLILPFLLVYFSVANLVYRNQVSICYLFCYHHSKCSTF